MKVPRYVFIHLNGFAIDAFMALLVKTCGSDWEIVEGFEKYTAIPDTSRFCSRCGNDGDLSGARLTLFLKDPGTLCIQNVIAYELNQSSCFRCNRILEGFYRDLVQPCIAGTQVTAELTVEEVTLADVVGVDLAELFTRFSRLANKATGSCHPCDRESWFDFILAMHAQGKTLNTDLLVHTLEEEGWTAEAARALGSEFEFGTQLMEFSRTPRPPARQADPIDDRLGASIP